MYTACITLFELKILKITLKMTTIQARWCLFLHVPAWEKLSWCLWLFRRTSSFFQIYFYCLTRHFPYYFCIISCMQVVTWIFSLKGVIDEFCWGMHVPFLTNFLAVLAVAKMPFSGEHSQVCKIHQVVIVFADSVFDDLIATELLCNL